MAISDKCEAYFCRNTLFAERASPFRLFWYFCRNRIFRDPLFLLSAGMEKFSFGRPLLKIDKFDLSQVL